MADDVTVDNGTLTDYVVASDDDGVAQHQYVKVEYGADGTQTPVDDGASALPIRDGGNAISVDDNGTTLSVDDGGGSLTVDGSVAVSGTVAVTQSGTWDEVGINDSGNSITVDNSTLSVVGGGTEATAMRVTVASDSTGVLSVDDNGSTISIDDGAGSITVDQPTGSNLHTVIDSGTVSTITNVVHVDDNAGSLTVDGSVTATTPALAEVTGTVSSAANVTNFPVDAKAYNWVSLQLASTGTLTAAWEVSNDNSTYIAFGLGSAALNGALATTLSMVNGNNVIYSGPLPGRYLKVRASAWTSGTLTLTAEFSTAPPGDLVGPAKPQDLVRIGGTAPSVGSGVLGTGTLRVVLPTDQPVIPVSDNAGSLTIDNAQLSVVGTGTEAAAMRVTIATDSTGVLSVDDNGGNLSIDDGGNSITVDNTVISVVGSGTEAAAQRVTIATDSTGVLSVDDNGGALTVDGTITASNTAGDIAHDAADSGNPVKVGGKAANALPTAVANNDRANLITDLWGRVLTAGAIDPAMQTYKSFNATSTQTGTDVWSPTSGKKIAVTYLNIGTYGTTAARVILWFGDNADTTYTAGTDQPLFAGSFAPSSTSKPGVVITYPTPVFCTTADRELHITTDAGISIDVTVYGYEW